MSGTNPWVRRTRRSAYEDAWIQVWHDEVTRPDGSAGVYGVVHFRERAVGILPVDADGRILLVGQFRYTLDRYSWEIPEGGYRPTRNPRGSKARAPRRDGSTASRWRLLIPRFSLSNSVGDQTGCIFVASGLTLGTAGPEPTEDIAQRWVALDEGLAMVDAGEIEDSVTQVALLRYAADRRADADP